MAILTQRSCSQGWHINLKMQIISTNPASEMKLNSELFCFIIYKSPFPARYLSKQLRSQRCWVSSSRMCPIPTYWKLRTSIHVPNCNNNTHTSRTRSNNPYKTHNTYTTNQQQRHQQKTRGAWATSTHNSTSSQYQRQNSSRRQTY